LEIAGPELLGVLGSSLQEGGECTRGGKTHADISTRRWGNPGKPSFIGGFGDRRFEFEKLKMGRTG
jgi:hypothetical protein